RGGWPPGGAGRDPRRPGGMGTDHRRATTGRRSEEHPDHGSRRFYGNPERSHDRASRLRVPATAGAAAAAPPRDDSVATDSSAATRLDPNLARHAENPDRH